MLCAQVKHTEWIHELLLHSWKIWWELNLADCLESARANMLADLKRGGLVQYCHTYICVQKILADFNLAVVGANYLAIRYVTVIDQHHRSLAKHAI